MKTNHPHKKVIESVDNLSVLVTILYNSKIDYVKKNLSIHLHKREISLLSDIQKHTKPHHKKVRIAKYQEIDKESKHFQLHQEIFLKRYKKLEKKDIIKLEYECDNGLPYDMTFTQKGLSILDEISNLEKEWNELVMDDIDGDIIPLLQKITINAMDISYNIQKETKNIY